MTPFSFVHCSDVVKKIDQSEFEGFEYINPLLMSAEECVWGTRRLCSHTHHPHTHSCTCYVASQCPQAAWLQDKPTTSTFCSRAAHAQWNAYLPKPVSHSAIYNHMPLSLPSFLIIFISCKSALISNFSSGPSLSVATEATEFFQGCCTRGQRGVEASDTWTEKPLLPAGGVLSMHILFVYIYESTIEYKC